MAQLEVKNLSLELSSTSILNDISFKITNGLNVLLGANGSGKTLLLMCFLTHINSYKGEIFYNGTKLSKKHKGLDFFSYVPSDSKMCILGQTGADDVKFSLLGIKDKAKREEMALDILKKTSASSLAQKKTTFMSAGELRRISIASAVAQNREVILLDEPFTGLDYQGSKMLIENLISLKDEGKLLLLVSHDVDKFLCYADNIIILNKGKLVATGKPEEVIDIFEENNIHRPIGDLKNATWL